MQTNRSFHAVRAVVRRNGVFLPSDQIVTPILSDQLYVGNVAFLPYNRIIAPLPSERLYVGNVAFLPYNPIVASIPFEGMYGGIWGKSIEYPSKV